MSLSMIVQDRKFRPLFWTQFLGAKRYSSPRLVLITLGG